MLEDLFGYGSFGVVSALVTALVHNASRLGVSLQIAYAGTGPPLKLARRHTQIDKTYDVDTLDRQESWRLRQVIEDHDIVISVMNRPAVLTACSIGRPSIFVNILYHLRDQLDAVDALEVPDAVPQFVSHFPGAYGDAQGTKLRVVDAIVSDNIKFTHPSKRKEGVVISFGGLSFSKSSAHHLTHEILAKYVSISVRSIVRAARRKLGREAPITLAIPQHTLVRIPAIDNSTLIDDIPAPVLSLSHEEMCALLSNPDVGYYFATSGVGNIHEALKAGVTMYPNPSANSSQYLDAQRMAEILEFEVGSWPPELADLAGVRIATPATESDRAQAMAQAVDVIYESKKLQHALEERILEMLERTDRRELGILQHGVMRAIQAESRGRSGAGEVAAFVLQTVALQYRREH